MMTCPHCGAQNAASRTACQHCQQTLPVPAKSAQQPPQVGARAPRKGLLYGVGLGLGCLPMVLVLSGTAPAAATIMLAGAVLYVIQLVAMIGCLVSQRTRFIGYGLATMLVVGPIVSVIGCSVIYSRPH